MLIVKVRNKKQIDKALKELKNKVYDTKQLKEIHNRKFIEGEADFFIYQTKPNAIKTVYSFIKRSISELIYYIKTGNILSTYKIFIRNYFYFLGHHRGLKSALTRSITKCKKVVHRPY